MDLLKLPTSAEGYEYLLLFVCAFTKYPVEFKLKTKDMFSVAEGLWHFISVFGSPAEIVSDNGSEFVNRVLEALAELHGISRRLTSAYRPMANGQVERYNRTVLAVLLKLSGNTPELWPQWLDFVMIAIRTAVHRVTRFTPFQLMFGRTWNPLRDFHQLVIQWGMGEDVGSRSRDAVPLGAPVSREERDTTEVIAVALAARAQLIRQELDWGQAASNVRGGQVEQRATQDKQHRVAFSRLPPGAEVWLLIEPRVHKLEHHFRGPFKIWGDSGLEEGSNYIVADFSSGSPLPRSVPRDKLFWSVNVPLSPRQAELFAAGELEAVVSRLDHVQPGPLPAGLAQGGCNPPGAFAISRFLECKVHPTSAQRSFLVAWEGYETPTWEPEGAFDPVIVRELLRKHPVTMSVVGAPASSVAPVPASRGSRVRFRDAVEEAEPAMGREAAWSSSSAADRRGSQQRRRE